MPSYKTQNLLKTPLRYPGGKSRAVVKILPLIPDFDEFYEPFVGGGSVFLALKQKFATKKFWINDLNQELAMFWQVLQSNPKKLVTAVNHIKKETIDGKELFYHLLQNQPSDDFNRAVRFFVLNRISFSGTVEAGGYSSGAFEGRFTNSSIQKLLGFEELLKDVKITNWDYQKVIQQIEGVKSKVFLFLDPPYLKPTKSRLYGKKGVLHTNFDHQNFAAVMKKCPHKWLITYDDCSEVREMFDFANIYPWQLQYGMNNYKQAGAAKGKELFISNYIPNITNFQMPQLLFDSVLPTS
jgi:DNA adenine methylase